MIQYDGICKTVGLFGIVFILFLFYFSLVKNKNTFDDCSLTKC